MPIWLVNRESPAYEAVVRICQQNLKPGAIIPMSEAEFRSWNKDVQILMLEGLEEQENPAIE